MLFFDNPPLHSASRVPGLYARERLTSLLVMLIFCGVISSSQALYASEATAPQALNDDEITVVSYDESDYNDPLMGFNRAIFAFNDVSYRYALIPIAKGYRYITPDPVETGISNVFANIKAPIHIVNHLLQWQPRKAGSSTARFLINTTIGIAFSNTLAHYGSGYGTFLVLPFVGPADLRSGTGIVADYFLNPIPYITEQPDSSYIMAGDKLQAFAPQAESYETLRAKSDDPYLFFRNMYLQGILRDQQYQPSADNNKPDNK
jgi:phospholipid-binding lipoprotein MlaA